MSVALIAPQGSPPGQFSFKLTKFSFVASVIPVLRVLITYPPKSVSSTFCVRDISYSGYLLCSSALASFASSSVAASALISSALMIWFSHPSICNMPQRFHSFQRHIQALPFPFMKLVISFGSLSNPYTFSMMSYFWSAV